MYIYRWDLDKTYLATDFDSLRGLWRSATEGAHEKRNVPGSAALLRALSSRPGSKVVVVSGSPTQMREVLAEKLRLDGVRCDELHLKDNLGNLKRGRFRAIRGQFGYKLPLLLQGRVGIGPAVHETLFGDDAEVDALVYSAFADVVSGRLRPVELSRVMQAAGAYPDAIQSALGLVDSIPSGEVVDRIFIHLDRGMPPARFDELGSRVVPVHSWFQAALVLARDGRIGPEAVLDVGREVLAAGQELDALANLTQDVARRGLLGVDLLSNILASAAGDPAMEELLRRCETRVRWLGPSPAPAARRNERIDYLRLLNVFGRNESKTDPAPKGG